MGENGTISFELTIEKLVAGGEGLGFRDGKAVFVPGVLPGERVSVETVESRTDFSRALLRGVLSASPLRHRPPCPLAGVCGGCDWLHIDYTGQLEQKKAIVLEALRRVGGIRLDGLEIEPGSELGYRSRIRIHVDEHGKLGFMRAGSNRVVPVDSCPVATPEANRAFSLPPPAGSDRYTVFGCSGGYACEGAQGNEELSIDVCGLPIAFSVRCFFQGNLGVLEKLVPCVVRSACGGSGSMGGAAEGGPAAGGGSAPRGLAADLYCGVGVFAAHLQSFFSGVTAVDNSRPSVSYAKINVPRGRNKFFAVSMETWTASKEALGPFEAIVVDPPRAGLSRKVRAYLAGKKPRSLVYVSCNPVTLARDLSSLLGAGFELADMRLFDFYPQTSHVEAVAVLRSS
jgi:23S rRNA (uracil1939-C5)-methyltransferase